MAAVALIRYWPIWPRQKIFTHRICSVVPVFYRAAGSPPMDLLKSVRPVSHSNIAQRASHYLDIRWKNMSHF